MSEDGLGGLSVTATDISNKISSSVFFKLDFETDFPHNQSVYWGYTAAVL